VNLTDVVDANVPFETRSVEHVRESTGGVVPPQHEDAQTRRFGQSGGRAEPSDAGADDNHVEWARCAELFVGVPMKRLFMTTMPREHT
jgi:hypothetical protein